MKNVKYELSNVKHKILVFCISAHSSRRSKEQEDAQGGGTRRIETLCKFQTAFLVHFSAHDQCASFNLLSFFIIVGVRREVSLHQCHYINAEYRRSGKRGGM